MGLRNKGEPINAFARWLQSTSLTVDQVSELCGIGRSYVYSLGNGWSVPGREIAVRIAEVSGGEVSVASWPTRSSKLQELRKREPTKDQDGVTTPGRARRRHRGPDAT